MDTNIDDRRRRLGAFRVNDCAQHKRQRYRQDSERYAKWNWQRFGDHHIRSLIAAIR